MGFYRVIAWCCFVSLQAMEIASKRTEEERSSQDKVDEEVSEDFCGCYEIYELF